MFYVLGPWRLSKGHWCLSSMLIHDLQASGWPYLPRRYGERFLATSNVSMQMLLRVDTETEALTIEILRTRSTYLKIKHASIVVVGDQNSPPRHGDNWPSFQVSYL
jgi:hypothetical protein